MEGLVLPPINEVPDYGNLEESSLTTPYRGWTQGELTRQYSCSMWSPRMDADEVGSAHVKVLTEGSSKAKQNLENTLNVPYGPAQDEKLDIFLPSSLPEKSPIFVYIHGGYWHLLGREMSSFMADSFISAGVGVVALGYSLGKTASMDERVSQIQRGVKFVLDLARGRRSEGVYIGGHSAGGHLSAMMLSVNWKEEAPSSYQFLKGVIPVSGLFDVRPFVFIDDNTEVGMDLQSAWMNSPANNNRIKIAVENNKSLRILVGFGQHDPPEFRRQSREYIDVLRNLGMNVGYVDVTNTDHFNVIESLREEDSILTCAILQFIKSAND